MSEFTFKSFFDNFQSHETSTEPLEQPVETQEDPAGEQDVSQPGTDAAVGIDQGQAAPSQPQTVRVDGFIEALKQRNMLSGDDQVDPDEIYEKMITRATLGARAQQENERLKRELESLRSSAAPQVQAFQQAPAQPPPPQNTPEAPAQVRQRVFRELQKYDPNLELYIERDENGYAKPRADFGQSGVDAARTINDYERASRQQAEMLIRDPHAIIRDNEDKLEELVERRAKAIVSEELRSLREEQESAAKEWQVKAAERAAVEEENAWHEQNKAKLFRLTPSGEVATDVLSEDGSPAFTSMGRTFISKLDQLRQQLPMVGDLTRRSMALEFAELKHAQNAQPLSQPAAPAPAPTPAQQKRTLAGAVAQIPNQNIPQASVHDAVAGKTTLRLADMVFANPQNAERVSAWR
jgi:hypothetical protein